MLFELKMTKSSRLRRAIQRVNNAKRVEGAKKNLTILKGFIRGKCAEGAENFDILKHFTRGNRAEGARKKLRIWAHLPNPLPKLLKVDLGRRGVSGRIGGDVIYTLFIR